MRREVKITFKDPTRGGAKKTKNYLDVYADGVLICGAYPERGADDMTYRIRTADLTLGLDQRRLFADLDAVAKHVRFCVGNSSRRVSYLRKEAGVKNLRLPSQFEQSSAERSDGPPTRL